MKKYMILLAITEESPQSPIIPTSVLENEGYQVTRVTSGEAAIDKLHENHFDTSEESLWHGFCYLRPFSIPGVFKSIGSFNS